jgi:hypothetical protein
MPIVAHESLHASPDPSPQPVRARAFAFYLPQFHPIPENDEWWGPGFTEWTNTARARPRFPGHYQPHIPADLGFYDLRLPEAREAQAALARRHHIEGFVYWHYWFAGRRLLHLPFDSVLASGRPDFGFCLAWANESWTGIWHAAPERVLMEQTYPGEADDEAHFAHLLPAFSDPRYLTIEGRPVFYVFHPEKLPHAAAFVERWQTMATRSGLRGLFLVAEVSDLLGKGPAYTRHHDDGFDAGLYVRLPAETRPAALFAMRAFRKVGLPEIYRYADDPAPLLPPASTSGRLLPCVYPNWDNTPRSGPDGLVIHGSTPDAFAGHVRAAIEWLSPLEPECRLLFVKSWNEWAEGNHLEPDLRFGTRYLEALASELRARG